MKTLITNLLLMTTILVIPAYGADKTECYKDLIVGDLTVDVATGGVTTMGTLASAEAVITSSNTPQLTVRRTTDGSVGMLLERAYAGKFDWYIQNEGQLKIYGNDGAGSLPDILRVSIDDNGLLTAYDGLSVYDYCGISAPVYLSGDTEAGMVFYAGQTGDTWFWLSNISDNGADDDDVLQIGEGSTIGDNVRLSLDTSGNFNFQAGNVLTTGTFGAGAITGTGLKILETGATPTFYGIFSIPDLSTTDKTYTFPTVSGSMAYSVVGTYAPIDTYINQAVKKTDDVTFDQIIGTTDMTTPLINFTGATTIHIIDANRTSTVVRYRADIPCCLDYGDSHAELSDWVINGANFTNTNNFILYWVLNHSGTTWTVTLYKDYLHNNQVAHGSRVGVGSITLSADNGSGLTGTVSYSGDAIDETSYQQYLYVLGITTPPTTWDEMAGYGLTPSFTADEYSSIKVREDDNYTNLLYESPGTGYLCTILRFVVPDVSTLTRLYASIMAYTTYSNGGDSGSMLIYNFTTNLWEEIATTDDSGFNDVNYTITSNISDYVYSYVNNYVYLMYRNKVASDGMNDYYFYIDYFGGGYAANTSMGAGVWTGDLTVSNDLLVTGALLLGNTQPSADNSFSFGNASARWLGIYAMNFYSYNTLYTYGYIDADATGLYDAYWYYFKSRSTPTTEEDFSQTIFDAGYDISDDGNMGSITGTHTAVDMRFRVPTGNLDSGTFNNYGGRSRIIPSVSVNNLGNGSVLGGHLFTNDITNVVTGGNVTLLGAMFETPAATLDSGGGTIYQYAWKATGSINLVPQDDPPAQKEAGTIYMDTDTHLYVWNGSAWKALDN